MHETNYVVSSPSRASSSWLEANKAIILCNSLNLVVFVYPSPTAVDILAATAQYEVMMSEPGGQTTIRDNHELCHGHQNESFCSIRAGGKRTNQRNKDTGWEKGGGGGFITHQNFCSLSRG